MNKQTTLKHSVAIAGVGLHTGAHANLELGPAPAFSGIVFRRTDLDGFEVPASVLHVAYVSYATALVFRGVMVATVEHLLAALHGCGVDNAYVDIDSLEVPIADGSARPFVDLIHRAGLGELDAPKQHLRIRKKVEVTDQSKYLAIEPADHFSIDCSIDFSHPLIGQERIQLELLDGIFESELAPARTFGFMEEAASLRQSGLIRGGSLENAIVLSRDSMVNPEPLRFKDEFVRHKVIDLMGDLALLGRPVRGHVTAVRTGHALHNALVSKLLKDPQAWVIIEE